VLSAQALERPNDFLLIHLHRVGDHTRGLFEADASIAISATHALKDVEIVRFARHFKFPPNELIRHTGKPTFCVVIHSVAVSGLPSALPRLEYEQKYARFPSTR
jgi:hypothetical protein